MSHRKTGCTGSSTSNCPRPTSTRRRRSRRPAQRGARPTEPIQAPEQAGDRSLDHTFDLVRGDTRWVLRGWDADEPTLYAFEASRDLPYWDPAPELDLWDQVVPTGGIGLLGMLDGIIMPGRGTVE